MAIFIAALCFSTLLTLSEAEKIGAGAGATVDPTTAATTAGAVNGATAGAKLLFDGIMADTI